MAGRNAVTVTVEVRGLDQLLWKLGKLRSEVHGKNLKAAVAQGAHLVEEDARRRAPTGEKATSPSETGKRSGTHQPGFLKRSVTTLFRFATANGVLFWVGWKPEAFYGRYQELGLGSGAATKGVSKSIQRRRERYKHRRSEGLVSRRGQGKVFNMAAQPFLGPAMRSKRSKARAIILAKLKQAVERYNER